MKKFQTGFSFLEIVISLSILIVLAMLVLPGLKQFVDDNQDEILLHQLLDVISLAKSEAQIRHVPVSICQSDNQATCRGTWEKGQLVFVDETQSGNVQNQNDIISIFPASFHGSIYWRSFQRHGNFLIFFPGKFGNNNGSFWHCHGDKVVWAIRVNKADRIRVALPDEDNLAQTLHCN